MSDLINRMDAIQACEVGPSDEWSKATRSGYWQAATDCARNILRIVPQPDPRDEVIKGLMDALNTIRVLADHNIHGEPETSAEDIHECVTDALAAAKAVIK